MALEEFELNNDAEIADDIFSKTERYLKRYYDLRLNIIANRLEIKEKDEDRYKEINEDDLYVLLYKNGVKISINNLLSLLRSRFVPLANPITDYFHKLPKWDGKHDYIEELSSYLHCEQQGELYRHLKKHLVRAVYCALDEHKFNKQCFVFVGAQNDGKSSFVRWLCPNELKDYYTEDISLDKEGLKTMATNFIINLDELSVLHRVEINQLKKFFSAQKSKIRPAFERKEKDFTRRASFFASTNQDVFLQDETGSVRWVVFRLTKIDWDYSKKVDKKMVWAQAYELYKEGYKAELTPEELEQNELRNSSFKVQSEEMELISKHFRKAKPNEAEAQFYQSTDIMEIIAFRTGQMVRSNSIKIGKAMAALGIERDSYRREENPIYGYWLIDKNPVLGGNRLL